MKIYELIRRGVLCNIETIIKKIDDTGMHDYSDLRLLITTAMKRHNKRKGIIYVNNWYNAKTLFYLLRNDINTYLYISKNIKEIDTVHKSIVHFEKDEHPAIIICIGKISYGYDNEDIDFICLADPRQSDIDIRQIVGRGLRWNHAAYSNKILHIMIPVLIDDFISNNQHLIKYLDYIIGECGADIINKNGICTISTDISLKRTGEHDIYTGCIDDIMILRQYSTSYYSMYSNFIKYIRRYNVCSIEDYIKLSSIDEIVPELHHVQSKYPLFAFTDIIQIEQYYNSKKECALAIQACKEIIINSIGKIKFRSYTAKKQFAKFLEIDIRIPHIGIELYYGI